MNTVELKGKNGNVEVSILHSSDAVVKIEDCNHNAISLSKDQASWLGTELNLMFNPDDEMDRIIILSGDVCDNSILEAQETLLSVAHREVAVNPDEPRPITLIINTFGGDCIQAFSFMDTIEYVRGMGVPVVGMVYGVAYSAGSFILQACTVRLIGRHSRILVHEVNRLMEGQLEELQQDLEETKVINKSVASIYAERNTAGNNTATYWLRFMKKNGLHSLSPEESLKYGLVDAVYKPLENLVESSVDKNDDSSGDGSQAE